MSEMLEGTVMETEGLAGDRRTKRRYDIELDLVYKTARPDSVVCFATGKTRNISSGGVLFRADGELSVGAPIVLSVRWPVRPHEERQVRLLMAGQIARCDSAGIAVTTQRYEFLLQTRETLNTLECTIEWRNTFRHGLRGRIHQPEESAQAIEEPNPVRFGQG